MASLIATSPLTVVILLLVSDVKISLVATLEKANSTSFSVVRQQLPIAGEITLQTVTSTSAIGCGNACTQFDGQSCRGFVYHTLSCDAAFNESTAMSRNCELMKFDNLTAVTLGPADNCRRLYVRSDLLPLGSVPMMTAGTVTAPPRSATPTAAIGSLPTTTDVKTTNAVKTTAAPSTTSLMRATTTDVKTTNAVETSAAPSTTSLLRTTTTDVKTINAVQTTAAPSTTSLMRATTTAQSLNPILIYTIQDIDETIAYMTSYSGYLYVTRGALKSTNQISVYNATSLQLIRYITVTGATGSLGGIVISPNNDYLFVSEYPTSYVYKVNMSSATNIKWSVATQPNGLTINRQNNLLVVSDAGKIQEYTTAGVLVREITDGNKLNDVKELSDGTLAISRYGPVNGVALLANNGTVLYSYGSITTGLGPGQMNWPYMLAVNSQGYVLVADSENNRVLVLNPTLSQASTVPLPISGLSCPFSIWLDESRDLLYVGESLTPYRLLVFTNVYNLNAAFTA